MTPARFGLDDLVALIEARALAPVDRSYTRQLLDAGPPRIAKKFGEEAVEATIAAVIADRAQVVAESADVLYHLLVMMFASDVSLDDVLAELGRRTRQSGHEEKRSRPSAS